MERHLVVQPSGNMVFTLWPSAHLRSLATGVGLGRIFRSSGIFRFVQGGVVKTFRYVTSSSVGYKRIQSAIRNLAHSFVSLMNYVDDQYLVDLLPKLLRDIPEPEITASLLDASVTPKRDWNQTFLTAVGNYRMRVRDHLRNEGVDPDCLTALSFTFFSDCLLYTSPSPRDKRQSRMPSSA